MVDKRIIYTETGKLTTNEEGVLLKSKEYKKSSRHRITSDPTAIDPNPDMTPRCARLDELDAASVVNDETQRAYMKILGDL